MFLRLVVDCLLQGMPEPVIAHAAAQQSPEVRARPRIEAELQETLDTLDYKCWYYETAKEAGSTHAPETMPLEKIPAKYRKTRRRLHNED